MGMHYIMLMITATGFLIKAQLSAAPAYTNLTELNQYKENLLQAQGKKDLLARIQKLYERLGILTTSHSLHRTPLTPEQTKVLESELAILTQSYISHLPLAIRNELKNLSQAAKDFQLGQFNKRDSHHKGQKNVFDVLFP